MPTGHRKLHSVSLEATRVCYSTRRVLLLCAVGFASALFAGCGELEPIREPEVVDFELTTDTLKASVRDAQRMVAELRADLEMRRRELAESQVARALLEGRVREAERRVAEARQVIDLQREELAAARTERLHVSRNSLQLQTQMKQLQRQLARLGKSGPASGQKAMQVPARRNQPSDFSQMSQTMATSVAMMPPGVDRPMASTRYVSVKSGDTLWNIAQKHRVQLEHLRTLNQLTDNRIVIGQTLWLPDDGPTPGVGGDKSTSP